MNVVIVKKISCKSHQKTSGFTLISAVILLLVLSLLGAWALSTNSLEERMAGTTRSRDLALQAAEAALKDAENTIGTWRTEAFNNTNGLLSYDAATSNDASYWRDATRWTSTRSVPTGNLNQVAEAPVYVIQKLPNSANPASPTIFNIENYRITTRAVGGNDKTIVILQSIISYTP